MLNGVGGFIVINWGMNLDVLAVGVCINVIDVVMFLDDFIVEVLCIIVDLNQFFLVVEGFYIFGLMGIIGWGMFMFIVVELGLIIQVFDFVQLVIIGVVWV